MRNTQEQIKLFGNLVTASGIFCIAVALILLVNYIHLKQSKPLESEALKSLIQQFQADTGNEALKQEIRNLDLLARKAFFTSRWQVNAGALMLLIGGIAFAAFLRIYHTLKARILEPLIEPADTQLTRLLSRRWILVVGGFLFVSAISVSFLTTDYLKIYEDTGSVVRKPEAAGVKVAVVDDAGTPPGQTQPGQDQAAGAVPASTPAGPSGGESGTDPGKTIPSDSTATVPAAPRQPVNTGSPVVSDPFRKNHPSFRGPFGLGVSYAKNIPVDWDGPSGRNIKWKVELSKKGYNSPVIWGDKLFIAGADAESRVVYCLNRNNGSTLWEHVANEIPGSPATPPRVTSDTGLSAPSVATDGTRVAAIFGTGDLVVLDLEGNRLWAKNLGVPDNHYGHSSSLICLDGRVIVQYDTNKAGRLLALNIQTGEVLWDTPRKTKISWASPIIALIDGRQQVITTASPTVAGYDFESGALLWSVDCLSGEVGPSAAYADGLVFAANEYATLAAIRPGSPAAIVWQADEYLPEASSPAVSDGLLFIATSYGIFVCYEATSGKKLWEKEFPQGFYGSPMIADGKVYVMERNGSMHIFKVDPTLQSLGDPVLGEKSVVTPAFSDGCIYLKGEKFLYCIGN